VARSPLKRGQLLSEADRARERRDVLALRDACLENLPDEFLYEIAETLPAGAPLYSNSVKLRRLVRRGQVAEAVVQDGAMSVSIKVEVLEDGVLGQFIRVRNLQSRREFRGKVENEQTILVGL
jgi:flagella basal body P-ring formation protein FlgA